MGRVSWEARPSRKSPQHTFPDFYLYWFLCVEVFPFTTNVGELGHHCLCATPGDTTEPQERMSPALWQSFSLLYYHCITKKTIAVKENTQEINSNEEVFCGIEPATSQSGEPLLNQSPKEVPRSQSELLETRPSAKSLEYNYIINKNNNNNNNSSAYTRSDKKKCCFFSADFAADLLPPLSS